MFLRKKNVSYSEHFDNRKYKRVCVGYRKYRTNHNQNIHLLRWKVNQEFTRATHVYCASVSIDTSGRIAWSILFDTNMFYVDSCWLEVGPSVFFFIRHIVDVA